MDQKDFAVGALIGGCIGGGLALLFAPKCGRDLRGDIIDGYNSINEQTHGYADNFKERAHSFVDSFQGEVEDHHNAFLVGGIAGTIIGALAGLLLAPQSGNKLRESLGSEYESIYEKAQGVVDGIQKRGHQIEGKLEDWKETFATIVDKLSSSPKRKSIKGHGLDDILDWANLGLRLYNQVQARR